MMRFFNFYPSQQKALAPGARVRVMGEIRQGFFGAEMVHPRFRVLRGEAPLPQALTPVYPTTAGLGQDTLRKLAAPRARARRPRGHVAGADAQKAQNPAVRGSGSCAAQPGARRRRAGAGRACPSGLAQGQVRRIAGAAIVHAIASRPPQPRARASAVAAFGFVEAPAGVVAVPAHPCTGARTQRDPQRSRAPAPDAALAAGRRGQWQDHSGRVRGIAGHRERLSGGGDGAHRDPRRAALSEIRHVVRRRWESKQRG